MSLSRLTDTKPNNKTLHLLSNQRAPPSSSSSPNIPPHTITKLEDSDEDGFRVPDVEGTVSVNCAVTDQNLQDGFPERRRGRNPVDKEHRRLKRLLRNRVSAQQARERKKVYLNDLESRAKELEDNNSKLEEGISTLINENNMLRKVLMNTRPKFDETVDS